MGSAQPHAHPAGQVKRRPRALSGAHAYRARRTASQPLALVEAPRHEPTLTRRAPRNETWGCRRGDALVPRMERSDRSDGSNRTESYADPASSITGRESWGSGRCVCRIGPIGPDFPVQLIPLDLTPRSNGTAATPAEAPDQDRRDDERPHPVALVVRRPRSAVGAGRARFTGRALRRRIGEGVARHASRPALRAHSTSAWAVSQKAVTRATQASRSSG